MQQCSWEEEGGARVLDICMGCHNMVPIISLAEALVHGQFNHHQQHRYRVSQTVETTLYRTICWISTLRIAEEVGVNGAQLASSKR